MKIKISKWIYPVYTLGKTAHVHSVFENSFNLEVAGRLINITNFSEYLSSYGISLPDEIFRQIFPYVQQGNVIKIKPNKLIFYSTKGVKPLLLDDVEIVSLQLSDLSIEKPQFELLKNVLESDQLENQLGLEINDISKTIFNMMKLENEVGKESWERIVTYLIGRGQGLTPSGDDILTTYLSILRVQGDSRAEGLASALKSSSCSTTDVSKNYISGALQGHVNSFVYKLFYDLQEKQLQKTIENDVKKIMQIGHSSGKDMSFGLLLGLTKL